MDLELHDKVALVTGGSRGLGRAVCARLVAEGARVASCSRSILPTVASDDILPTVASDDGDDAPLPADRFIHLPADVSREQDVQTLFDAIEQRFGTVDVLVNNAAVCPTCQVADMALDVWSETLAANLTGVFLTCRDMVRRLLAAGRPGRIVNVSSTAALLGSTTGHAPYDASKGGVLSLTYSLAREVAAHGIAVNAVAPGMMRTEMTAETLRISEARYLARIPLQRIGEAQEVADVIVFLASARASYMTGAVVNVSGGLLMR
jgi:3-oxoacyl-[acyl-carrier protein] reductase